MLQLSIRRAFDEFERHRLAAETKRGMREGSEQGYRMGGRAPYGYLRQLHAMPDAHRGDRTKSRVTLAPEPDEAHVVAEIFHLHADKAWSPKAIADHLNRPCGPPPPSHVDPSRSRRSHWSASTIRSMLHNPVYTGKVVWGRLDFATAREAGGTPRLRAQEDWVVAPDAHLPLVSDEVFSRAQERFETRPSRQSANGNGTRSYLFAGMVHCATGHQPLSMQGKARKGHHYYACSYGSSYGDTAAAEVHAGQKWIYLRESALLPLVERFFEQRIFGPLRLDKLARQLQSHGRQQRRETRLLGTRLRQQIAEADRKIKVQIQALEDGIEPELVTARISELRDDKQAATLALAEIDPSDQEMEADDLQDLLGRIPDLTQALRDAPVPVKRQTFEAFGLRIEFDKAQRRIEVSAIVSEAVAQALENTKALREEGLSVTVSDIAGARFVSRGDARIVERLGVAA